MHGTIGTMNIMDRTGHTSISWDPDKKVEVDVAKDTFDRLLKEGYNAFEVETTTSDKPGKRMTKFDPKAGKILMVPQLVGG